MYTLTPADNKVLEQALVYAHFHHIRYSSVEVEALAKHAHVGGATKVFAEVMQYFAPGLQMDKILVM